MMEDYNAAMAARTAAYSAREAEKVTTAEEAKKRALADAWAYVAGLKMTDPIDAA